MDATIEWCPEKSLGRSDVVPYITSWSGERTVDAEIVARGVSGIGYADEPEVDRDEYGVLWVRQPTRIFQGHLDYGRVHPSRQRFAMRRLLCQVCGDPQDRDDERGVLWLLPDDRDDWWDWPEGLATTAPPTCLSCAELFVDLRRAPRRGYVAVRARRFPLTGVYGLRYRGDRRSPVPVANGVVSYNDPAIRWTRAARQVRTLFDCAIEPLGGSE
jgi:hypothetical protein